MLKKLVVLMCIFGLIVACGTGVRKEHFADTDLCPEPVAVQMAKPVLNVTVYFDFDKSVLKPEGKAKLDEIVKMMAGADDLNVVVEGHTDKIGTDKYNQALSERRAAAVKAYLVDKGIDEARIGTVGFGETRLVSKTNWENRRAVILSVD